MRAIDRDDLAQALEAAASAARYAGLLSVDEDKDLQQLGRALREHRLPAIAIPLATTALRLRQGVVVRNLALAQSLARRIAIRYSWINRDDANQVAAIALMQAVARYRPGKAGADQGWLSTNVYRALERWAKKEQRRADTVVAVGDAAIFREEKPMDIEGSIDVTRLAIDVTRLAFQPGMKRAVVRLARRFHRGGAWTKAERAALGRVAGALGVGQKYDEKDSNPAARARSKGSQSGHENG